jgi:hypothetical protein
MAAVLILTDFFGGAGTATHQTLPESVDGSSKIDPFIIESHWQKSSRPTFPYSVIPGGIENVTALKSAIARDPVVAANYANFDLSKAHIVKASAESYVYVSYRIGDQVFWTTRRLKIASGEALITDGRYTSRTRCGNLISLTPQKPMRPVEPDIHVMDVPEPPNIPSGPGPVVFDRPTPMDQPSPPGESKQDVPRGDGPYPNVPTIYVPIGGDPTPVHPPAVPVPEPGMLPLLFTGLFMVWALRKRYRH